MLRCLLHHIIEWLQVTHIFYLVDDYYHHTHTFSCFIRRCSLRSLSWADFSLAISTLASTKDFTTSSWSREGLMLRGERCVRWLGALPICGCGLVLLEGLVGFDEHVVLLLFQCRLHRLCPLLSHCPHLLSLRYPTTSSSQLTLMFNHHSCYLIITRVTYFTVILVTRNLTSAHTLAGLTSRSAPCRASISMAYLSTMALRFTLSASKSTVLATLPPLLLRPLWTLGNNWCSAVLGQCHLFGGSSWSSSERGARCEPKMLSSSCWEMSESVPLTAKESHNSDTQTHSTLRCWPGRISPRTLATESSCCPPPLHSPVGEELFQYSPRFRLVYGCGCHLR